MVKLFTFTSSLSEASESSALAHYFTNELSSLFKECRSVHKNSHEIEIQWCRGCEYCQKSGQLCVQHDGMTILYPLLQGADVIVLASPIYWWGISAQLKVLIDRLYALKAGGLRDKQLILIVTGKAALESSIQYRLIQEQFHEICGYLGLTLSACLGFQVNSSGSLVDSKAALLQLSETARAVQQKVQRPGGFAKPFDITR